MPAIAHNAELAESGHLEDTLYDLMQPDTLSQYGAEAHMLRTQANPAAKAHSNQL